MKILSLLRVASAAFFVACATPSTKAGVENLNTLSGAINIVGDLDLPAPTSGQNIRLNISATPEWYGAKGDGVNDDAPAIFNAMTALALAGGGQLRLGCSSTYLVASIAGGASFINPRSNVSIVGCGPSSVIKVADGANENPATAQWRLIGIADEQIPTNIANFQLRDLTLDLNASHNSGHSYQNQGLFMGENSDTVVDHVTFKNLPGNQAILLLNGERAKVSNNSVVSAGNYANSAIFDFSGFYVAGRANVVTGNTCWNDAPISANAVIACVETHGSENVADTDFGPTVVSNNISFNFTRFANAAADTNSANSILFLGNDAYNADEYIVAFTTPPFKIAHIGIHGGHADLRRNTTVSPIDLSLFNNTQIDSAIISGVKLHSATSAIFGLPGIRIGRVKSTVVDGNIISDMPSKCLQVDPSFPAGATLNVANNVMTDCSKDGVSLHAISVQGTSTAKSILINSNALSSSSGSFASVGIFGITNASSTWIGQNSNAFSGFSTNVGWSGTGLNPYGGGFGAAVTVFGCGTSPSIRGGSTAAAGEIFEGSSASGCNVNFESAPPTSCVVTYRQPVANLSYGIVAGILEITHVAASGIPFSYQCTNN